MILLGATIFALAAAGGTVWWAARPPRLRSTGDRALHRLAEGVYVYRGHFSNSAVLVTGDAVVVVDTQVSPQAARHLRACLRAVTDRAIKFVVNTHYHGDHTGGNAEFPEAEVVATALTARYVVERDAERLEYTRKFGLEIHEVHPILGPARTFEGRLELEVGGERIEVLQLGAVETPDACVVHWPARRVVACGDGVATWDYPYLGVPFMDEGLRDDGEWIGFLRKVKALEPEVLIAGHGPALVGRERIAARLDLLIALYTDLLAATGRALAAGAAIPAVVARVDQELAHYRRRPDLREEVTGQRFAIYRCINSLLPERAGRGWWDDLRPSIIRRDERDADIAALEAALARDPRDAAAWGALADRCFDGGLAVRPRVDGTEYLALANAAAKRALALDPDQPLARLNLGVSKILGAMVLAQPMASGMADIERALSRAPLTTFQRRKAAFFLGKAHQYEERPAESDRWFREALPAWARPAFPVVRQRMRCTP